MKEIILSYFFNYIFTILLALIYTKANIGTIDDYVAGPAIYVVTIYSISVSLFLYFKNKIIEQKICVKDCLGAISLGISIAIIFNMSLWLFSDASLHSTNLSFFPMLLISSGIVGPIFEEILFRYVFFNRLLRKYNFFYATFINSCIFAFIHFSVIKSFYAFILGTLLCLIYQKKNNIIIPILVHIAANSIILFLNGFSFPIFCISIIILFIYTYIIFF